MLPTKVRLRSLPPSVLLVACSLTATAACGEDDPSPSDASVASEIDAMASVPDAMNGVVCPGAEANYPGTLNAPTATDDTNTFEFRGELGAGGDVLRISIASSAAANATVELPDAAWSVQICVDDDGNCSNALDAYSGTMTVTSVEDRFRANLDRIIFADDLSTPTCSSSVSQAAIDVAILGPI